MVGLFLVSWLLAPALILALTWGCGLFVHRTSGRTLRAVYVLPVGFALIVLVGGFLTSWDATAELTGPVLVMVALAGFALAWRGRPRSLVPRRELVWPLLAAAVPFAVVAAPVVLTGMPGFTGYGRIVDIGHQFDFAAYISSDGRSLPAVNDSAYTELVGKLVSSGYPGGWQGSLGGLSQLLGVDLAWIYQPFLAVTAAMAGLSVYGLTANVISSRPLRGIAGAVAAQPNVLYAYGVVGGCKEFASATLILLTAGLLGELRPHRGGYRSAVPLAVALAACLAVLNLTVVPWLGILLAGAALLTFGRIPRRWPRAATVWVVLGALVAAMSIPTISAGTKLAKVAGQAEGSDRTVLADLGNLAAPMPVEAAIGVWFTGDYRYTEDGSGGLTTAAIVLIVALGVGGIVYAIKRRQWLVPLLALAGGIALAYYVERTGPWLQLKAIAITGPIALVCAFVGAGALVALRGRRETAAHVAGWVLVLIVAGAVLYGNALAYHEAALSPSERLRDLERIGERIGDYGPTLYPAHEEYAEYFLRDARTVSLVNAPTGRGITFRSDAHAHRRVEPIFAWDVDELVTEYLQTYEQLVRRRGPRLSRPPSNWSLVERTPWHEVWRRERPPESVLLHQPLDRFTSERSTVCRAFVGVARNQNPADAEVAYSLAPVSESLDLQGTERSPAWPIDRPGGIFLTGPGVATGLIRLPEDGTWTAWIGGSISRRLDVEVDERPLGSIERHFNYPEQWEEIGTRSYREGRYLVQVIRPGGDVCVRFEKRPATTSMRMCSFRKSVVAAGRGGKRPRTDTTAPRAGIAAVVERLADDRVACADDDGDGGRARSRACRRAC